MSREGMSREMLGRKELGRKELAFRANALRALHVPGQPLILPNVWDAATAAIVAAAGFPAIATSSAAVAESLGYRDGGPAGRPGREGGGTPPDLMFATIERISGALDNPVTADVERGYGLAPGELVERLIVAGAAGCNVEDSVKTKDAPAPTLVDADEQVEFISAMRDAASRLGVPIVINARIDTFLLGRGEDQASLIAETLRRARLYRDAGADCVFPILASEPEVIRAVAADAGGPVNILRGRREPAELAALGIARISYGGATFHDAMARFSEAVQKIKTRDAGGLGTG